MLRWACLGAIVACSNETTFGADVPTSLRPGAQPPPDVEPIEDRIVQMTAPEVDVLWVIDPSCSMGPYQDALTQNFPSFVQYFVDSELDWHIGVTSTDMDGVLEDGSMGRLRRLEGDAWLTADTPDVMTRFSEIASVGTAGSSSERGTSAVHSALTERLLTDNRGFFRPHAAIHTIVISDEANQIAQDELHFDGWVRWYDTIKISSNLRTFSAITGPLGTDYERASQRIGGATWPIDTEEWDVVLERLGFSAAGLRREFFLSQHPYPETIEVWLELDGVPGQTRDHVTRELRPVTIGARGERVGHYVYQPERNSVRLEEIPPETTTLVRVRYVPDAGY